MSYETYREADRSHQSLTTNHTALIATGVTGATGVTTGTTRLRTVV
jgi:hypothetical protein